MESTSEHVVVVGQGYVGLPVAMRAVHGGYDVVGFEVDPAKVDALNEGRSHVEDITAEMLRTALDTGRYRASADPADLAGFEVAVISVPTPMGEGVPDLSYIESAAEMVAPHVTAGSTVILESTTYPGTTEELVAPILEAGSGLRAGADFHLGYSPERIDPGNPTWRLENTPKVVSGVDEASLAAVKGFFDRLVDTTVPVSGTREAELTKLLENTFRHVNIALVNELAMFARDLGIDVWESIDAASTKPFGYMRFTPGPGVGGHCLPIDPSYLSWQVERSLGQTFRFVELANDVNEHMPDYVVRRAQALLNDHSKSVRGSTIVVYGLAYKANTSDARETPARPVIDQLCRLGAEVCLVDPHVAAEQFPAEVTPCAGSADDLADADLVIYLVDHDDFDREAIVASGVPVLDCLRALSGPNVQHL
ncbi:MAG TPA: nucleotide sugar dehydrogenase [Microthrixaceae bacterium]|nr:nucleotide sugar dehydrogenase [Microthrixaceae bacterium]